MSTFNYHTIYDQVFDSLCNLITDPDSFSADLYEDADWIARFDALPKSLAEADLATNKTRKTAFLNNLFVAKGASKWFKVALFDDYISLWKHALADNYIPDCVCQSGPSPTEVWQVSVSSPNKPISRTPPAVNLAILPPAHPPVVPAGAPTTSLSNPLVPGGNPFTGTSPALASGVPVQPSVALQAFLLGGGSINSLPTSANPGTAAPPLHLHSTLATFGCFRLAFGCPPGSTYL